MEHEGDGVTSCNWCTWNDSLKLSKRAGGVGNRRTSRDHSFTALLRSARILRSILDTRGDLLSLRLQWKTPSLRLRLCGDRVKTLTRSKLIIIIIKQRLNYIKAEINYTQQNSKCRLCGEREETINHVISKCCKLAPKKYKPRTEWEGKVIH